MEAKAWLDAGWRVESVNQAAGEVMFRTPGGQPRTLLARSPAARLTFDPQVSANLAARQAPLDPDRHPRSLPAPCQLWLRTRVR